MNIDLDEGINYDEYDEDFDPDEENFDPDDFSDYMKYFF